MLSIDMEDMREQVKLDLSPQWCGYVFLEPHFVHECEDKRDDELCQWIGHMKTHYDTPHPNQFATF